MPLLQIPHYVWAQVLIFPKPFAGNPQEFVSNSEVCCHYWNIYLTDILGLGVLTVMMPHSWPFSGRCDEDNADQTYCAGHGTCVFDVSTTNGVRCQCDKNYGGNTCSARLGKLSQFNSFHPISEYTYNSVSTGHEYDRLWMGTWQTLDMSMTDFE